MGTGKRTFPQSHYIEQRQIPRDKILISVTPLARTRRGNYFKYLYNNVLKDTLIDGQPCGDLLHHRLSMYPVTPQQTELFFSINCISAVIDQSPPWGKSPTEHNGLSITTY
tara:strand:- start:4910 stop:5242 length:333 start_codon:yes stop_codon:yes gene_type:complete